MKKDKEWAQRKVDKYLSYEGVVKARNALIFAKGVIEQLDEQQKPIIPQFVADWIEKHRGKKLNLISRLDFVSEDGFEKKTKEWLYGDSYEENLKHQYLLVDAVRYGYEVKKEKQYFIIEPVTGQFLIRDDSRSRGVKWVDGFSASPSYFTENEIKAIDKRYWEFAEEEEE